MMLNRPLSAAIGLGMAVLAPMSLPAAPFTVNSTTDATDVNPGDGVCETAPANGICTLRAAIMESNALGGSDSIDLPAGTYNLTIASGSTDIDASVGDLDIGSGGVTIAGAGAGTTTVVQTTTHRVFEIPVDIFFFGSVTFQDFTIQGGNSSALGVFNEGAAIQAGSRFASLVTLKDMVIAGNTGAAAVSSKADLRIEDSTISGNTGNGVSATNDGSTPANNAKELEIIDSTIDNNTASGVAIGNLDSGVVTNSTISSNGIYGLRAQYTIGDLIVTNSTIASNTSNGVAGIGYFYVGSFIGPDIVVRNSIVADNAAGDIRTTALDANAVLPTSQGYNIISDSTGTAAFTATGDANATDPMLQALNFNSPGTTRTHALSIGSPAIDTASSAYAPATDQRGVSRPQGLADDKGAYEFEPPMADVSISKSDGSTTIGAGNPITYTIVVGNAGPSAVSGVTVADTLPATLSGATWTCLATGGASCGASGTGDIDDSVDLPLGGSATYTLAATLDLTATGSLVNTATATLPSGASDPNTSNNTSTDTNTIIAAPTSDVSITKTDGSTTADAGQQVTYTIVASNGGPDGVTGVTVADTLPGILSGATWTCVAAGGATCTANGTNDISDSVGLPVGGTATYTLVATLDAGATGTLVNTATAAVPSGTIDPVTANNTATDTDTIIPPLAADAGPDRTTASGMPIDPDTETIVLGGIPAATGGTPPYTYSWSLTGTPGTDYTLSATDVANPDFTGHTLGQYTATLTVTDTNATQATDDALLEVVFPDQRDIVNTILTGTQTLGACSKLTAEDTTFAAGSDITLFSLVVELLNGVIIEPGAIVTIVNGVPPECAT